jgi:ABC-2 family transporter protein
MNKFAAMLKDSYKEAIDGWIFQIMLILAGLFVLLVASISVEATTADRAFGQITKDQSVRMVPANRGDSDRMAQFLYRVEVSDVTTIAERSVPWDGQYQFTADFAMAGFGGIEMDADKKPTKPIDMMSFQDPFVAAVRYWATKPGEPKVKPTDELKLAFVKQQLTDAGRLKVTDVQKLPGNKFRVSVDGTTSRIAWPHTPSLFFGAWTMRFLEGPLGGLVYLVENGLVNTIGAWIILLSGVIVTAGFVPNMMRKGAIDLMLTKPMSRPSILLMKYIGGLMFVVILTTIAVGGVWIAIGVRTGVWTPGILYCIGGITFYFSILYAVSTLVGVLTRNAIVCIVVTMTFWFFVWLIGFLFQTFTTINNIDFSETGRPGRPGRVEQQKADKGKDDKPKDDKPKDEKTDEEKAVSDAEKAAEDIRIPIGLVNVFEVLNRITPRTKDLDTLTDRLVGEELLSDSEKRQAGQRMRKVDWTEVIGVASTYLIVLLGLALWRFVTRSY